MGVFGLDYMRRATTIPAGARSINGGPAVVNRVSSRAAAAAAPTGGGSAFPAQSQFPVVQTTIDPQPIYSPQQTQTATNQAIAEAQRQANPWWLMKKVDRPGVSRSSAFAAAIAPEAQEIFSRAALQAQQIPFSDAAANAQNILRGQVGRENEALGLAQIMQRLSSQNQAFDSSQNASLMQLIASLMGGILQS